jgi:hypothetical protein
MRWALVCDECAQGEDIKKIAIAALSGECEACRRSIPKNKDGFVVCAFALPADHAVIAKIVATVQELKELRDAAE